VIPLGDVIATAEEPATATKRDNSGLQQMDCQETSAEEFLETQEFLLNLFKIVVQLIPSVEVLDLL
jgi:hypothetical protein